MRKLFILLVFVLLASLARADEGRHVTIFLSLMGRDPVGERTLRGVEGDMVERMKRGFPEAEMISFRPLANASGNPTDFKNLVAEQLAEWARLHPDAILDALLIDAHGRSDELSSSIFNKDGSLDGLDITDLASVDAVFGALKTRWAPGAHLLFDSCELVSRDLNAEKKLERFSEVAKAFGLRSGTLYMNQQVGMSSVVMMNSFNRVAGVLAFPVTWLLDNTIGNHGFSLVLSETGRALYKDNSFLAQGEPDHHGALVIQR